MRILFPTSKADTNCIPACRAAVIASRETEMALCSHCRSPEWPADQSHQVKGQKERGHGSVAHTRLQTTLPVWGPCVGGEGWEMQQLALFRSNLGEEQV